jgi:hypothetical protein
MAAVQFLTDCDRQIQENSSAITQRELLSATDMEGEGGQVTKHTLEIQAANPQLIPAWVLSMTEAIAELLELPSGWNSYHARPVALSSAQSAIELLKRVMSDMTPAPDIVPTSLGGVQLEWHTMEIDIEITVPPIGVAEIYIQRSGARSVEGTLPQALSDLQSAISELSVQRAV